MDGRCPKCGEAEPVARAAALAGIMDTAEDALADALAGHRADRLRALARQLRKVAGTLERAGRRG